MPSPLNFQQQLVLQLKTRWDELADKTVVKKSVSNSMSQFFTKLFGFKEGPRSTVYQKFQIIGHSLVNKINNEQYTHPSPSPEQIGTFQHLALKDLRQKKGTSGSSQAASISVVYGSVEQYLADERNCNAVFQVASQFNCLEMVDSTVTPESGITIYQGDHTQGPCCAIAAAPATVFRNYFIPLERQGPVVNVAACSVNSSARLGQYADLQLNGMDEMDAYLGNHNQRYFSVCNGYLLADAHQLAKLQDVDISGCIDKIKVGVQSPVQVTSKDWGQTLLDRQQVVTQVFCAAAAISYSPPSSLSSWHPLAYPVLEANYEAVLRVAATNPLSKIVYLTLLGGGAFGNPVEWVADAIASAARKVASGLDIRIVCFSRCPASVAKMVKEFNAL